MAVNVGSLYASLNLDMSPYAAAMARAQGVTASGANSIRGHLSNTTKSASNAFREMAQSIAVVHGPLGGVASRMAAFGSLLRGTNAALALTATSFSAIGFGSVAFVRVADRARLLANQLRTVTSGNADFLDTQEKLFRVAQNTRSSLEATTTIYARTARATDHLGLSQEKLLRITETVQKAFAIGGATAQEAAGAAIQLSQGIASNRFSGEEFRSVAENAPVLLKGIAESLGVGIGRLREMAHAGELTADTVTRAILGASTKIDEEFAKTSSTVGQSLQRVGNSILKYFGEVDSAYGITANIARGINNLADNFEGLANSVGLAIGALTALTAGNLASRAVRVLGALSPSSITASARRERAGLVGERAGIAARIDSLRNQIGAPNAKLEADRQARIAQAVNVRKKIEESLNGLLSKRVEIENKIVDARNQAIAKVQQEINASNSVIAAAKARNKQIEVELNRYGISPQKEKALNKESLSLVRTMIKEQDKLKKNTAELVKLQSGIFDPKLTKGFENQLKSLDAKIAKTQENIRLANGAIARAAQVDKAAMADAIRQRQALIGQLQTLQTQYAALGTQITRLGRLTSFSGAAMAKLSAAGSSLLSFLGGWWGVAFTAAIGALMLWQHNSAKAAAETEAYEKRLRDLGLIADETGDKVGDGLSKSLATTHKTLAQSQSQLQRYIKQLQDVDLSATRNISEAGSLGRGGFRVQRDTDATKEFERLRDAIINGKISLTEFNRQTDELVRSNPKLAEIAATYQKIAQFIDAARRDQEKLRSDTGTGVGAFTDTKSFDEAIARYHQNIAEYTRDTERAIEIAQAEARGNQARADALRQYYNLLDKGKEVDISIIERDHKKLEALEKQAQAFKRAQREAENFQERLKRLNEEAQGAFLGEIDRQVLEHARAMKAAASDIKAYVDAARTGDFSSVSAGIMKLRDIEILKSAGQQYREIIRQYGTLAQVTPLAAEQQKILNAAVEQGGISALQAKVAFADFLIQFSNYRWIGEMSDAFGRFAVDAIMDMDNLEDALDSLRKTIQRTMLELTVAEPLKNAMKLGLGGLAGIFGFGGGPSGSYMMGNYSVPVFSAKGNVFGPGGVKPFRLGGVISSPITFPFKNGVGLAGEAGPEAIMPLTRGSNGELGVKAFGGGIVNNVQIINNSSAKITEDRRQNESGGVDLVVLVEDLVAGHIASGQSRINTVLQNKYGLDPTAGIT